MVVAYGLYWSHHFSFSVLSGVPMTKPNSADVWPALPFESWQDTCATLHMWTQIVGKIRLMRAPMVNHWWQIALYVTPRGLTTSPIPDGGRTFEIVFDFIAHRLVIEASDGQTEHFPLAPMTVADFYAEVTGRLRALGIDLHIWTMPQEIPDAIPFDQDRTHRSYDAAKVHDFWKALVQADRVFHKFRSDFLGKVSPVHFFWGSFDLCVTRFSGRTAPPHPGGVPNMADWVTREAYSHEVSSCGFWPGNGGFGQAAFYAYAYATPQGFGDAALTVPGAYFDRNLGEFILPYDAVRSASDPDRLLLDFLQQTYVAAADLAAWDRAALERQGPVKPGT